MSATHLLSAAVTTAHILVAIQLEARDPIVAAAIPDTSLARTPLNLALSALGGGAVGVGTAGLFDTTAAAVQRQASA